MKPELTWLVASALLGLAYVLIGATYATLQRGLKWNAGNRDVEPVALTGAAARAARANANFLETFPLFAAVVLAVVWAQRDTAHTALGAELYFWARLVYLPVYIIGIPYLRTVIWAVSIWGMLQLAEAFF